MLHPKPKLPRVNVSSRVFERAAAGRSVTVEMHQGYFGMLWYGDISPQ
jgi:hypothetical protein